MSVKSFICCPISSAHSCEARVHSYSSVQCKDCLLNREFVQLLLFDIAIAFYDRGLLQTAGSPGT